MDQVRFSQKVDLSSFTAGRQFLVADVDVCGDLVLLIADHKSQKAAYGGDENGAFFPWSKARSNYSATYLLISEGVVVQKTELPEIQVAFPYIQPLPNGEILVVGARCHYRKGDPEKNAAVFDVYGKCQRQFVLGDGINSVQTTRDGMIWVSYFDEGVFGNYGWDEPLGASGLVCFNKDGAIEWTFNPPQGFDHMCDCYALNVSDDVVWACYYTDFPVVKIDSRKQVFGWKNKISAPNAIAVHGEHVLFYGGYDERRNACVIQKIQGDGFVKPREIELSLPADLKLSEAKVIGRGSMLHAIIGKECYSLDLRDIV